MKRITQSITHRIARPALAARSLMAMALLLALAACRPAAQSSPAAPAASAATPSSPTQAAPTPPASTVPPWIAAIAKDTTFTASSAPAFELAIALPKPMFVGTPKPVPPGVEMVSTRPPLMVPRGVGPIAKGCTVTASDREPIIGEIAQVCDGLKDGADGYYVELAPGVQWVQFDLGQPADVFALCIWHYFQQMRVYQDVIVQCADDPDFVTGVRTLFNNDADNSAGMGIGKDREYVETHLGKLIDCRPANGKPARTRYLRLYSNGNTSNEMNHYVEVEVFGRR